MSNEGYMNKVIGESELDSPVSVDGLDVGEFDVEEIDAAPIPGGDITMEGGVEVDDFSGDVEKIELASAPDEIEQKADEIRAMFKEAA